MRSHEFAPLRVLEVVHETDAAVSIVLDVPQSVRDYFGYQPGQFLTIRRAIGGKLVRRCYSLSSSPDVDARPVITVKRVAEGRVSNDLCSNLRAGDTLDSMPPGGLFVPKSFEGDFLLFAGGSGITPILSIAKSALRRGQGKVLIIYANRDEQSVIFKDVLKQLVQDHEGRLTVIHWLESLQGIPTGARLKPLIRDWTSAEAFMCGPQPFMDGVTVMLEKLNVPRSQIHAERFVSLPDEDEVAVQFESANDVAVPLTISIDGAVHNLDWPADAKLLDVMLAAGLDAPFSCRVGGCSTCMCRVIGGRVEMLKNLVLDSRETADGWVLACQAIQQGEAVSIEIPS